MKTLLLMLMVGVGMIIPLQAGLNAEFRRHAGHPLWAGLLNFGVGLAGIALVILALRLPLPGAARLSQAPPWAWLGGLCGATLVVSAVITAPRLGAAVLMAALVSGQLISSVALDHFGAVGFPVRPVSAGRVLGIVLLLCGLFLIHRE